MIRLLIVILLSISGNAYADGGLPFLEVTNASGQDQTFSVSLQIIMLMTLMTMMPALLLTMTSFTRVIIVLGMLRQAMGMPQTPSNQILIGMSLFLTFFVMSPVMTQVYEESIIPYTEEKVSFSDAVSTAQSPVKGFMIKQVRFEDLELFANLAKIPVDIERALETKGESIPLSVMVPAFITSEIKTAFQIGLLLFIPFLVIDLIVASILMAMGMMMLSPLIISLPFKIMVFILVDGWTLIMGTLASSFG
ncbi:MAG: flagellar type III secretion system pore protein FliP [Francisellaceae bacterium]|jgi:flagellar biosynthesis protein FliP|nr:flagellar type III secretion system pore protein FliP [Francisellaceae bacterium]MBT6207789.1 flagellar type III secretion system pore protein FliP [Francisellaceae bacterium]MBT6539670.1 flagellar type III secretion system pore protein FliP [Francisellaceae bacterium]